MISVTGTVGCNKGVVLFKAATSKCPMSIGQKARIYVGTVAQPAEPDMSKQSAISFELQLCTPHPLGATRPCLHDSECTMIGHGNIER